MDCGCEFHFLLNCKSSMASAAEVEVLDDDADEEVFNDEDIFDVEEAHGDNRGGRRGQSHDDVVDYATPLETSKNIEEVSQVRLLINPMLNVELTPTIEGVINRNIKFLYCFLAKDSVTTGPTTSTAHILEQIVIAFADLMKGTFRKKQYWHDHFYDYFPGNKIPEFVERYIQDIPKHQEWHSESQPE